MKQNKKTIAIITVLLLIILSFVIAIIYKESENNKYLVTVTYNELSEKLNNKETFILYIGKENCSACQLFNPKFKKIIKEHKIKTYYIDLATLSESEQELLMKNINFPGTPTVLFINDGIDNLNSDTKIVGNISESKIIAKLKNRGYIK